MLSTLFNFKNSNWRGKEVKNPIEIIIPIPNIRQDIYSETRCALPIAARLAVMLDCSCHNDILVRISKTKCDNSILGREEAAKRDLSATIIQCAQLPRCALAHSRPASHEHAIPHKDSR